jgi:FdhE protein
MPFVTLAPASRESRLAAAQARWTLISARRPDLAPAVELQRQLLTTIIDLSEAIEHGPVPRLSLPARYVAAKLHRGVPALAGEPVPIPTRDIEPTILRLCDQLAAGGAGDAARNIRHVIASGQLEAGSLLSSSLARNQTAIRSGAVHRGLAPDLLWLVGELAVSPFAHRLQRAVFESLDHTLQAALDSWALGYCAACGSWPALAERLAGRAVLRCSFCAAAWSPSTSLCLYCGKREPATELQGGHEERRLTLCSDCKGYLKEVEVAALSAFPLVAIADLETMDLDLRAMELGYHRPALREFTTHRS